MARVPSGAHAGAGGAGLLALAVTCSPNGFEGTSSKLVMYGSQHETSLVPKMCGTQQVKFGTFTHKFAEPILLDRFFLLFTGRKARVIPGRA
jgi:hypothetical protein